MSVIIKGMTTGFSHSAVRFTIDESTLSWKNRKAQPFASGSIPLATILSTRVRRKGFFWRFVYLTTPGGEIKLRIPTRKLSTFINALRVAPQAHEAVLQAPAGSWLPPAV